MPKTQAAASPPPGVTPNLESPEDVLYTINLVSQILAVALVTPFVLIRIYAKAFVRPPFVIEDWTCIAAWILAVLYSCTAFVMHHFGGGYHVWEVTKENYKGFLKALYADTIVYGPNAYLTKVALLLVVVRVFSVFKKTKIVTYVFMTAMAGYYIPVMIIKATICRPIRGYWDSDVHTTCLDERAVFVADTVVSALTDAAVLILPIPATLALRMPFRRKIKVLVMLGIGGIATLASFVRLYLVIRMQKSTDQTVDFVRFNLLGTAEVSIGLICACLPACNILFVRIRGESPQNSDLETPQSFRMRRLKFLKGSRLRTESLLTSGLEDYSLIEQSQSSTAKKSGGAPRLTVREHPERV